MPIIIRCKKCGETYHIGPDPVSINRFIELIEMCRSCGHKMNYESVEFYISHLMFLDDEDDF